MAFNRPSLSNLVERIAADFESRLPGTDARLRRSNVGVMAKVWAGAMHGLYGYGEWASRQITPDTADAENLERWAAVWGVTRRAPIQATGSVQFTGTDGMVIPVGTRLQRADAIEFETTASATLAAGVATVPVRAIIAGANANTAANSRLVLAAQILGVNAQATVTAGTLKGGADIESDDSLRVSLLERIQKPPQGGSNVDYVRLAKEVAGVTRVWVYPSWMGAGTVGVFFVRDGDASLIPDGGEVAAVQAHIDSVRPVAAEVFVVAPTALPVNISVQVIPNTTEVKAAVAAELADVFLRESSPGGTLLISHLHEAISLASGETNHVLTVPAADVVAGAGQMPVLGTITWL